MDNNLLPYLLVGAIGFILAKLTTQPVVSPFFQDVVIKNIKLGKKVVICVDNEATMFEMVQNRIRITRHLADMSEVKSDAVSVVDSVDTERTDPAIVLQ